MLSLSLPYVLHSQSIWPSFYKLSHIHSLSLYNIYIYIYTGLPLEPYPINTLFYVENVKVSPYYWVVRLLVGTLIHIYIYIVLSSIFLYPSMYVCIYIYILFYLLQSFSIPLCMCVYLVFYLLQSFSIPLCIYIYIYSSIYYSELYPYFVFKFVSIIHSPLSLYSVFSIQPITHTLFHHSIYIYI